MEYYFFVIIVIIILKILFWTFYFYVRAQRMRQARPVGRLVIVGTQHPRVAGRLRPYNDRSAIINHAEPVSEQALSPPPYSEVVKDGNPLPPPYEQAVTPGATAIPNIPCYPNYPGNTQGGQNLASFPQGSNVVPPSSTDQSQSNVPVSSGQ